MCVYTRLSVGVGTFVRPNMEGTSVPARRTVTRGVSSLRITPTNNPDEERSERYPIPSLMKNMGVTDRGLFTNFLKSTTTLVNAGGN